MKNLKDLRWIITTVVLVLITFFSIAGTVVSKSDFADNELEEYYLQKEQQLTEETREYLNKKGFQNSGVTVTHVVESDGSREYKITVHHGDIDRMSEGNRAILAGELEKLVFEDERCSFCHEFLVNN